VLQVVFKGVAPKLPAVDTSKLLLNVHIAVVTIYTAGFNIKEIPRSAHTAVLVCFVWI